MKQLNKRALLFTIIFLSTLYLTPQAFAQPRAEDQPPMQLTSAFKNHVVHYTLFDSTFILPEVAKAYGIKRSKNESLLNVTLTRKGEFGGIPATLEGTHKNLMQQQKRLHFTEIKEKDAVYYLAPVRVSTKELLHFELNLSPNDSDEVLTVKFSQKVYPSN